MIYLHQVYVLLTALAGAQSDYRIFSFSAEIVAIPVAVLVVSLGAALFFYRKKKYRFVVISFIFSLLAGLVFAPSMYLDRVIVSPTSIQQKTGFWWNQTIKQLVYEEISRVRITTKPTGRKGRMEEIWEITYKDGRMRDFDPGDLWEANGASVIEALRRHGIEVE